MFLAEGVHLSLGDSVELAEQALENHAVGGPHKAGVAGGVIHLGRAGKSTGHKLIARGLKFLARMVGLHVWIVVLPAVRKQIQPKQST